MSTIYKVMLKELTMSSEDNEVLMLRSIETSRRATETVKSSDFMCDV